MQEIFGAKVQQMLADRLSDRLPADGVVVLPQRIDESVGVYRDDHLMSVKELAALGLRATFLQDPDERVGLSEYSTGEIVGYAIGVSQDMSWDAIQLLYQFLRSKLQTGSAPVEEKNQLSLKLARLERDGLTIEELELTVSGADFSPEQLLSIVVGNG